MRLFDLHNPFNLEPIIASDQFFGREKETRRVLGFLQEGQSVSVVGPAKIGKTSFIFHIMHPAVRELHRLATEHVFVYLDSRLLADCDQGECYLAILKETIHQVKNSVTTDKAIGA